MQIGEPTSLPNTVVLRLKKSKVVKIRNIHCAFSSVAATRGREAENMEEGLHASDAQTKKNRSLHMN